MAGHSWGPKPPLSVHTESVLGGCRSLQASPGSDPQQYLSAFLLLTCSLGAGTCVSTPGSSPGHGEVEPPLPGFPVL